MAKKKFHLTYNAPVTLTFAFICLAIFLLDSYVPFFRGRTISTLFTAPGRRGATVPFDWKNFPDYFRMIFHVAGHADWNHLLGNFSFILLLGPLLEERYGSLMILVMILVTSLVTGVVNVCFIPSTLLGASSIAFMFIILSSIVTLDKKEIPLSFVLIVLLFIGRELYSSLSASQIAASSTVSIVAHIVGGVGGSLFGFLVAPKNRKARSSSKTLVETDAFETKSRTAAKKASGAENDLTVVAELGTIG